MGREAGRIERVEGLYVLEELIELGVDFQGGAPILAERVHQPVEREDKAFGALAEQRGRSSLRGKFPVQGRQRPEQ